MNVHPSSSTQSSSAPRPQKLASSDLFGGTGSSQSGVALNSTSPTTALRFPSLVGRSNSALAPPTAKPQLVDQGCGATREKSIDSDIEILGEVNLPSTSNGLNCTVKIQSLNAATTSTVTLMGGSSLSSNRAWKNHSKNTVYRMSLQDHVKMLTAQGIVISQHQAVALRLKSLTFKYIAEHVIRSLNEYGWAVVDNFLGAVHCRSIYREVCQLYEVGLFSAGQLMDHVDPPRSDHGSSTKEIRSDEICWFDGADARTKQSITVRLLISMVDSVIVHFKDRIQPYTIGGRSRAMIAVYPGSGTRYVKHVDNPVRDGRCITSIYYCNENWRLAEHGGALRLYPESSNLPMDVDPQADRLIFFFSDKRNPHEVMPVFRPRYAITIWYFDQREKAIALERRKRGAEEDGVGGVDSYLQPSTVGMDTSSALPNSSKTVPRKIKRVNVCDSDGSDDSDVEEEADEARAVASSERPREPADYYEI